MSRLQSAFCRSAPWRTVARRGVLPWALQGVHPSGQVLEIGAGSGAMAAELLASHPEVVMTVTDFDEAMVEVAATRLARFGDRVTTRQADATQLPYPDEAFDAVLSWVMLHHTVRWEEALAEAMRVLRPGGQLLGWDLRSTVPLRLLHRDDADHVRLIRLAELREATRHLPVEQALLTPSLGGLAVRFNLRKSPRRS